MSIERNEYETNRDINIGTEETQRVQTQEAGRGRGTSSILFRNWCKCKRNRQNSNLSTSEQKTLHSVNRVMTYDRDDVEN